MRILLVDDDVEVTEYVRRGLEEEGHTVLVCHDGAAALRAAELHAFDIIVLDVMMPFVDGLEVTRRLRRQHIHAPIVLLTARDAPEEVVRGIEEVWGEREVTYNNLEVFIRFLRAKLDCAGHPSLIHTERGLGYRLRSPEP